MTSEKFWWNLQHFQQQSNEIAMLTKFNPIALFMKEHEIPCLTEGKAVLISNWVQFQFLFKLKARLAANQKFNFIFWESRISSDWFSLTAKGLGLCNYEKCSCKKYFWHKRADRLCNAGTSAKHMKKDYLWRKWEIVFASISPNHLVSEMCSFRHCTRSRRLQVVTNHAVSRFSLGSDWLSGQIIKHHHKVLVCLQTAGKNVTLGQIFGRIHSREAQRAEFVQHRTWFALSN